MAFSGARSLPYALSSVMSLSQRFSSSAPKVGIILVGHFTSNRLHLDFS